MEFCQQREVSMPTTPNQPSQRETVQCLKSTNLQTKSTGTSAQAHLPKQGCSIHLQNLQKNGPTEDQEDFLMLFERMMVVTEWGTMTA